jgi:hypothetical protein
MCRLARIAAIKPIPRLRLSSMRGTDRFMLVPHAKLREVDKQSIVLIIRLLFAYIKTLGSGAF